jgi:hypothetical protein
MIALLGEKKEKKRIEISLISEVGHGFSGIKDKPNGS